MTKEVLFNLLILECMSMHQPWASLLIEGIKRVEGRYWDTKHRGRLWIASTSQDPTEEDIEEVESFYKEVYKGEVNFPKHYPKSVLLGCVDLYDVKTQEEYVKTDLGKVETSDCDFVFHVRNPRKLIVPFSILGKPKIYDLNKEVIKSAQSGLYLIEEE